MSHCLERNEEGVVCLSSWQHNRLDVHAGWSHELQAWVEWDPPERAARARARREAEANRPPPYTGWDPEKLEREVERRMRANNMRPDRDWLRRKILAERNWAYPERTSTDAAGLTDACCPATLERLSALGATWDPDDPPKGHSDACSCRSEERKCDQCIPVFQFGSALARYLPGADCEHA